MVVHAGPGHADITLSLCGEAPGGGHWHQAWSVCECGLAGLRARLGPPLHESLSDAEAVRRVTEFVRDDPGRVHLFGGELVSVARFLVPGAASLLALCAGAGAAAAGDAYGRSHVPVLTRYVPVSSTVTSVLTLHPADRPAVTITRTVPGPVLTIIHTVPGPAVTVFRTVTVPAPATVAHTGMPPSPAVTVTVPGTEAPPPATTPAPSLVPST